jgi:hypothetical protein
MEPEPLANAEIETTPADKGIWGPWATVGFGALVLVAFFAVMAFIIAVMIVVLMVTQLGEIASTADIVEHTMDLVMDYLGLMIGVAGIGSYAVGTALILAFIKVKKGRSISEYLGLKRIGWRMVLLLLLITGVYLALVSVISSLANIPEEDTGILFEGFRYSRLGLAGAILLTSLVWTGLHVGYSLYSLGAIFIFGIVLGYVRYRTGSLWSTVIMHAFYNLVGMSLIALNAA